MSDNVDKVMNDLEKKNAAAESPFSPERMQQVRQKLEGEQRELAKLGEPQSIEEDPQFQYLQDRVALERELEKPPNPNLSAEIQRAHEAALLHEIAVLKQQHANDGLPPGGTPGSPPPASGERAVIERAESGPEKKDKELYLAEKRLSKL